MWALVAPLVEPVLKIFSQVFGVWMGYKAGKDSQRAQAAENAMDQHREMQNVEEDRRGIALDERRKRLHDHFSRDP